MTWNRSDLLYFELAGEQDLTDLGKLQVSGGTAWVVATCPHLTRPWAWVAYKFPTKPLWIPFWVENRQKWYDTGQICLILNIRGNNILPTRAGCRCHLFGWWPLAHTWLDLGLRIFSHCGVRIDWKWHEMGSICSILNFLRSMIWLIWAGSRCQVPPAWLVATFPHLGGPWVVKTPPPDPSGPFCGVKIGNNHFSSPRTHF